MLDILIITMLMNN